MPFQSKISNANYSHICVMNLRSIWKYKLQNDKKKKEIPIFLDELWKSRNVFFFSIKQNCTIWCRLWMWFVWRFDRRKNCRLIESENSDLPLCHGVDVNRFWIKKNVRHSCKTGKRRARCSNKWQVGWDFLFPARANSNVFLFFFVSIAFLWC